MNTQKILKIISQILDAESTYKFQASLNHILNHYNQNQPNELNQVKEAVYENINRSIVCNYVNTDLKILNTLELYGYFDISIKNELESILNSQSHEIVQKLTNFIQKRDELIKKITNLKESLLNLGIKISEKDDGIYQLVFSFPEKYHKLDNLSVITKDVDMFLKSISANLDEESRKYEIVSVNDGCIEFYIEVAIELADLSINFLQILLQIKGAIDSFNDVKKIYDTYSAKRKKSMEETAKEELKDNKKKYIESFIKNLKINGDNKHDDETRIRGLFNKMVKYFEEGVSAEVKTPLLEKPRDLKDDDDKETVKALKEQIKLYQRKEEIDKVNRELFYLQQEGFQLNLPNPEDAKQN